MARVEKRSGSLLFVLVFAALAAIIPIDARAAVVTSGDVTPAWDPLSPWDAATGVRVGSTPVGGSTSGAVTVDSSDVPTTVTSSYLFVGSSEYTPEAYAANGTVTVTGSGAAWNVNSTLRLGAYMSSNDNGTLNITNGGSMSLSGSAETWVGSRGTGALNVDGAGSAFNAGWTLYLGAWGGTGSVNISNGGTVNSLGYRTFVKMDEGAYTSTGSINFGAGGGTFATRSLYASPTALTGAGTVNVNGLVSDVSLSFSSASDLLARTLTGFSGGPTVNLNPLSAATYGDLGAGYAGTGSIAVSNGVALTASGGYLGYLPGSSGSLTIEGAGSTWTNGGFIINTDYSSAPDPYYVGYWGSGTVLIQNGGKFDSSTAYEDFTLGACDGSSGTATVTGTGSKLLITTGSLTVGGSGTGTLNVASGGSVSSRGLRIGNTGAGVATLDGGTWNNPTHIYIGYSGNGTLNIKNGGVFTSGSTTASAGSVSIGDAAGTGLVTVDGAGSRWTLTAPSNNSTRAINLGGVLDGSSASGQLKITNGGLVSAGNYWVAIAPGFFSTGTLSVEGSGSSLTTNKKIYVGQDGTGSLSIKNGAYVSSGNGTGEVYVGGYLSTMWNDYSEYLPVGSLTVDGTNSRLLVGATTAANLQVGPNGAGNMTISNGGAVTNFDCYIGGTSGTDTGAALNTGGTVTVSGAASIWTNKNNLYVGNRAAGVINLDGGTILANSIIGTSGTSTAVMTLNFNGGTLKPYTTPNGSWIQNSLGTSNLYVKEGGAIFDTNGYSTAIALPLRHGGSSAADGGVTKLGAGTLTLGGNNTYTGWTTVSGGILSLGQISLYDASNVRVDTGTTLNLTFSGPDTVHYLFFGGLAQTAGTYDVSNSGGFITGGGSLYVSATALQGDADLNGTVNSTDLGLLLSHYNQVGTGFAWGLGDFDANGTINSTDLGLLLSHYNQVSAATSAVPEPSTLLLLAASLIGLLAYAWRKQK